jgi:hypothetical protein
MAAVWSRPADDHVAARVGHIDAGVYRRQRTAHKS